MTVPLGPSLEVARERVVQTLCAHYARDHVSTQELEARLERVYTARTEVDLRAQLAGLPVSDVTSAVEPHPLYSMAGTSEAREHQRILTIMGETKRRGAWTPARRLEVRAVMSEVGLDLREARLLPGVTTIDVSAVMAQVTITVPPGVRVDCNGSAIMGSFTDHVPDADPTALDAPTISVTGLSVMAEVKVRVRLPNESALEALKRDWSRRLGRG